ncbi:hypothetical protein GAH_00747 [Geoglobus ahangari]|uniref:Uncharacterized protein n=1 Tax=Geoglobus ahangari TaxID=113653 RepID=A0A0F7IGW0_9EURY|nr:hypothetical protein [Geoglobus ahangari]AKG91918.1 hypothetical protein GAH_00747 [Geoglobus ahangari]
MKRVISALLVIVMVSVLFWATGVLVGDKIAPEHSASVGWLFLAVGLVVSVKVLSGQGWNIEVTSGSGEREEYFEDDDDFDWDDDGD